MSKPEENPRQKILLAAIECVEKAGIQAVTIRSIARQAGVNSAAINYHFRSKEKLLEEVMKTTAQHTLADLEALIREEGKPLSSVLTDFFLYVLEGAIHFPNLTKAHFYDTFVLGTYKGPFVSRFNDLLKLLAARMPWPKGSGGRENGTLRLVEAVSAVMLPALAPKIFNRFSGVDFTDYGTRRAYVSLVVAGLLRRSHP